MADLEISVDNAIMVVRLNRPKKKNAISDEMLDGLRDALRSANDDPTVRCVIITGSGDAFCAGGDLSKRAEEAAVREPTPLERRTRLQNFTHKVALDIENFEKPLIAAINGPAVGAGMDLALMCDLRIAGTSARFSEAYIRVGILPGNGGCYFLPRVVGTARALELLWTGDFVDAEEAQDMGLVSHVYPDAELMDRTMALAKRFAEAPPVVVRDIKKLVFQSLRTDLRTSLNAVSAHMAVVLTTDDCKEAMQAYKEKRKPTFHGR